MWFSEVGARLCQLRSAPCCIPLKLISHFSADWRRRAVMAVQMCVVLCFASHIFSLFTGHSHHIAADRGRNDEL